MKIKCYQDIEYSDLVFYPKSDIFISKLLVENSNIAIDVITMYPNLTQLNMAIAPIGCGFKLCSIKVAIEKIDILISKI